MRCEIDKQSWPQEVKVQEEVFVTAPVPPELPLPPGSLLGVAQLLQQQLLMSLEALC